VREIRAEQVRGAQRRDACGVRKGGPRPWLAMTRGDARGGSSEEIAVAVANADSDVGGGRSLCFSHRRSSQTDGTGIECWRSSMV
jgi:hypothetical protein